MINMMMMMMMMMVMMMKIMMVSMMIMMMMMMMSKMMRRLRLVSKFSCYHATSFFMLECNVNNLYGTTGEATCCYQYADNTVLVQSPCVPSAYKTR